MAHERKHVIFILLIPSYQRHEGQRVVVSFKASLSNASISASFSVAKYDLGKVRIKPMQSAVSPFTQRDLQSSPLETCRAIVFH